MPQTLRWLGLTMALIIGNAHVSGAQNSASAQTPSTSADRYEYRLLVGRKNETALRAALGMVPELADFKEFDEKWRRLPTTPSVCAAFNKSGNYFQTRATDVTASDEIVILAARWKVGTKPEDACALIAFRDIGIRQQEDITLYSRGFDGGAGLLVQIRNQGLEDDVRHAIDGRFKILRIPVSRLLRYSDANEKEVRVQHDEVLRLAVTRRVPTNEGAGPAQGVADVRPNADAADESSSERHLYWEFQISRRWTWTRMEFPTLWSYAPDSKTAKALPVAAASGLRLGLPVEFPRYIDFTFFGAPAFKLKSDSSSADVTSFTYGGMVDLADYVGVAFGVDNHDGKSTFSFLVSIGNNLRSAFPK